ncbi:MFS transporter [Chitinophagaceae bacterium 26-R-25]|nr:MFS transporter [Chitinophagaceae bacterium 26-R-25]
MSASVSSSVSLTTSKATRREWLGLTVLVLPTLLVSMDMTITYLALPAISASLKPTSAELLWITDIYGFLESGLLIVMGTLGDRIGLKKLLITGCISFAAASTLAAFSTSAFMLIVSRAIMGIAGATLLPTTLSLIRNLFRNDVERTFAMGLYTTCFSSGTMIGPMVGGFLLNHFWWGSVFLIALPILFLLLLSAPFLLPEFKDNNAGKLDLQSAMLLIASILFFIFGVKRLAEDGFSSTPLLFIAAGIAVMILFIKRQQTLPHPLFELKLFNSSAFTTALLSLFIALFSWSGMFFFVGQFLQLVSSLDSFTAGLWTIPSSTGSIVLCMLAPLLVKRFPRGNLIVSGIIILAIGIGLISFISTTSLALLIAATVLMSGGCGLIVTLGIDMVVASAPPEKAGAAAGISETSTALGGSLGIALLGSFWTLLYRHQIAKHIPALTQQKDAETIKNTLGGTAAMAKKLPPSEAMNILNEARSAFVHSLNITAAICALIIVMVAILAAKKFGAEKDSGRPA